LLKPETRRNLTCIPRRKVLLRSQSETNVHGSTRGARCRVDAPFRCSVARLPGSPPSYSTRLRPPCCCSISARLPDCPFDLAEDDGNERVCCSGSGSPSLPYASIHDNLQAAEEATRPVLQMLALVSEMAGSGAQVVIARLLAKVKTAP